MQHVCNNALRNVVIAMDCSSQSVNITGASKHWKAWKKQKKEFFRDVIRQDDISFLYKENRYQGYFKHLMREERREDN